MEKKTILLICRLATVAMAIIIWCFTAGPAHSFQPQPEPPGQVHFFVPLRVNPGQDMLVHVAYVTPTKPIKVQVSFVDAEGNPYMTQPLDMNPRTAASFSLLETLEMNDVPAPIDPTLYRVEVKALVGSHSGALLPTVQLTQPLDQPAPFFLNPVYLPWLHPQQGSQPAR